MNNLPDGMSERMFDNDLFEEQVWDIAAWEYKDATGLDFDQMSHIDQEKLMGEVRERLEASAVPEYEPTY